MHAERCTLCPSSAQLHCSVVPPSVTQACCTRGWRLGSLVHCTAGWAAGWACQLTTGFYFLHACVVLQVNIYDQVVGAGDPGKQRDDGGYEKSWWANCSGGQRCWQAVLAARPVADGSTPAQLGNAEPQHMYTI